MTTLGPKRVAAAFTLLAALAAHADDHASKALEIEGPATVVDGNHITIKDQLIRLAGMQAPSNKWCEGCGDRAKEVLEAFVRDTNVWCRQVGIQGTPLEVDGAALSHCQTRKRGEPLLAPARFSERSVNWHMVNEGWGYAFSWLDFFGTLGKRIAADGARAKVERRGMWHAEVRIPNDAYARTSNRTLLPRSERTITGEAEVIDGETLRVGETEVQLAGVAGLNDKWCIGKNNRGCASAALETLKDTVEGEVVRCEPTEPPSTRSARTEAFCTLNEKSEHEQCDSKRCWINWQVIERGDALARRSWMDIPTASRHKMATILGRSEQQALLRKRGLWSDTVDFDAIEAEVEDRFAPLSDGSNSVTGKAANVRYHDKLAIFDVQGVRLILDGVAIPPDAWCTGAGNRRCTAKAMRAVKKELTAEEVTCSWIPGLEGRSRTGHKYARCQTTDGTVINSALIQDGNALAYLHRGVIMANARRVSHEWVMLHLQAREQELGIWRGRIDLPRRFAVD